MVIQKLTEFGCPENIITIYSKFTIPVTLILVAILGLLAFFGYRIFKYAVKVVAAVAFAVLGNAYVLPLISDFISPFLPEGTFNVGALAGFVFALIGLILSIFCYKFVMFLAGGGLAYLFADALIALFTPFVTIPAFFLDGIGKIVLSVLLALVCGLLVMLLFKLVYILATSIGSLALAFALILLAVIPNAQLTLVGIALGIGAVIGLIAMCLQFKADAKIRLIRI